MLRKRMKLIGKFSKYLSTFYLYVGFYLFCTKRDEESTHVFILSAISWIVWAVIKHFTRKKKKVIPGYITDDYREDSGV